MKTLLAIDIQLFKLTVENRNFSGRAQCWFYIS